MFWFHAFFLIFYTIRQLRPFFWVPIIIYCCGILEMIPALKNFYFLSLKQLYPYPSGPALDQETVVKNVQNEKTTLVQIAVAHFILTVPNTIFTLFKDQADVSMDPIFEATIGGLFYWMTILRSVITPILLARNDKRS